MIGSRTGGVPELIQDGVNGFLVDPGDVDKLQNKMAMVMKSPEVSNEIGQAARERIMTHFHARRSADEMARALDLLEKSA